MADAASVRYHCSTAFPARPTALQVDLARLIAQDIVAARARPRARHQARWRATASTTRRTSSRDTSRCVTMRVGPP